MSTPLDPLKKGQKSTYAVYNGAGQTELERLTIQNRLLTITMGGTFAEQPDPNSFRRVLDVSCGSGGWVLDAAQAYPTMSLTGIDISQYMIDYANKQAELLQVADRVKFQVMDALLMLQFPDDYFDLVNLRLGFSFLRIWDWPKMIREMLRVTRPYGIVRVVECELVPQNLPPALSRLYHMLLCAFYRSGHLFSEDGASLIAHMPRMLTQHGCENVQTRVASQPTRAGTEAGQMFAEDMENLFQSIRPFLRKWGCMADGYDALYSQAVKEMQEPMFDISGGVYTFWGHKSGL